MSDTPHPIEPLSDRTAAATPSYAPPSDHTSAATPSYAPPGTGSAVPLPTAGGRYVLGEEIARGGMGAVLRATDTTLGREVAVKVLLGSFGPDSAAARRFAEEARITGQLQHPNIPAVHDLGTLPDGRPFLAMKLIKGDTLDRLLKLRPEPAAEQGRWLGVFEAVCQAVGYAHAHGVVHRDLKPQNVMVGAYGEVQVMDWGLAKVLSSGTASTPRADGDAEATVIRSERDTAGDQTQTGSALGTPTYMPPEQAIGAIDQIDGRSDVFGLGGILAAILTGRPPFAGDTPESARQMAARGKLDECFARLDGCGAEAELVALCKRCLSAERSDRPADAGEVAEAVAEWRHAADERARQAELDKVRVEGERAAAELQAAEQRKRRRVQLGLGGLVLATIAAGGLAAGLQWYWRTEAASAAEQQRAADAERALAEVTAEQKRTQTALDEGNQARADTVQALRTLTDEFVEDRIASKSELTEEDRQFFRQILGLWQSVSATRGGSADARALRAEGLFRIANMQANLGEAMDAITACWSAAAIQKQLTIEFPSRSDYRQDLAATQNRLGDVLRRINRKAEAEVAYHTALVARKRLAGESPTQPDYLGRVDGYPSFEPYEPEA